MIEARSFDGDDIDSVAADMCRLADRMHVRVVTVFRGVRLSVGPRSSPRALALSYYADGGPCS